MMVASVLSEDLVVRARLADFGLDKQELADVAIAAIIARNDAVPDLDPSGAGGQFSYIHGTRALRRLLIGKGWQLDRTGHIEGAINTRLRVKFVFQNTNTACGEEIPKAISGKGPAARMQVADGQMPLFPESMDELKVTQDPASVMWFLCVALHDGEPVAELLCPRSIEDRQFYGAQERIFILKPGDLMPVTPVDDEVSDEPEIDVPVTRKA